ncbi:MAG TPA: DUF2079 domain-containing protein [Gaiellaceae bacterium]|nr:DUF2079 domain-containing protein [Gaiellaceae bacterium]
MRPKALLWAAIAAYAVGFGSLSILRHRAYTTGRYDLGNMVQTVWNTAHGHFLQMTGGDGVQISRLAAHFDPILAAFAPLWWIWPSPEMLLAVQAVAVALGALPVYRLAHKHLGSERAGLGFALVYLLYPATEWLTLNEFHPVALSCPLLLFAFWYLDEDRLAAFAVCAVVAMTTKEEVGLVVAGLGVWYAVRRRPRVGVGVAAAGLLVSAIAIAVVVPHFNSGADSSFYGRYDAIGGSAGGIARTAFTHPWTLFEQAFQHRDVHYLLHLLPPLALLFVLSPLALIAAAPELALNQLSATPTQTSIHFHYTAAAIPPLVVAAVFGAAALARRFPARTGAVVVTAVAVAVAANWKLGAIPLWTVVPGGEDFQAHDWRITAHDRVADRAVELVPAGAVVSSTNVLGAHLSARRRVLSLPKLGDATWVVADETRSSYADRVAPLPSAAALVRLRKSPDWTLVFEEDGVLVFHRRSA